MITCNKKNSQWHGTNPNLLLEVTYFATKENVCFNAVIFFKQFYGTEKKGSDFIVGILKERKKLNSQSRGYLMPFIQMKDNVSIASSK